MPWVVVIPEEGRACVAAPSFGMTPTFQKMKKKIFFQKKKSKKSVSYQKKAACPTFSLDASHNDMVGDSSRATSYCLTIHLFVCQWWSLLHWYWYFLWTFIGSFIGNFLWTFIGRFIGSQHLSIRPYVWQWHLWYQLSMDLLMLTSYEPSHERL